MTHARIAAVLLAALAAPAALAQTEPPPPPVERSSAWQPPPRFLGVWLRGGAFIPATPELSGGTPQATVGLGLGIRALSFLSGELEGSWISRDFAPPPGGDGRTSLESRGFSAGLRAHHPLWILEPSLTVAAAFLRNRLTAPTPSGGVSVTTVESASSTGLVLGGGLDFLVSDQLSVGFDWRWLQAKATFSRTGPVTLAGQAAGGVVRLYWP